MSSHLWLLGDGRLPITVLVASKVPPGEASVVTGSGSDRGPLSAEDRVEAV